MGLITAAKETVSKLLGDQWREYFYCESLSNDTLAVKGIKRVSSGSSNKNGTDNIISNGAIIAVADGQCMMIVQQGAIVEFSAEPGEFVWDSSTEPSIFYGKLGQNLKATWETVKKRFTLGGDAGNDQRVYYFNTKEIIGNKYGTASPVPFRVVDQRARIDMDISIKCFGEYSYKLADPMLFYKNVCGNISRTYTKDEIDSQLKSEFLTALQPAFAKISDMGIRYSSLPGHTEDMANALNDVLSNKWRELRGIEIVSVGVNSVKASEEDEAIIKEMQRNAAFTDPTYAGAAVVGAQTDAMRTAAANESGAMNGFIGMGMAMNAGGANPSTLFQIGQQQGNNPAPAVSQTPAVSGWTCECGTVNTGKFCQNCGKAQPAPQSVEGWTCACGSVNQGNFCQNCGAKRPAGAPLYQCDKCGWKPEDPKNPPKFCPNCGDPFDENDIQK